MKFTSKSKFRAIAVLFLALAVTVSCALWSVFGRRGNGEVSVSAADNTEEIKEDVKNAANDFETITTVGLIEGTVNLSGLTVEAGKRIRFVVEGASDNPFNTKEGTLQITGEVTIEAQAEVIFDLPVELKSIESSEPVLNVYGTLTINDTFLNNGTVNALNAEVSNEALESRGVIVNGSFNHDASRGGALNVGAEESDGDFTVSAGGALFIKGSNANASGLTVNGGTLTNNGSVIYDNDITEKPVSDGVVVPAKFVSVSSYGSNTNSSDVVVFYDASGEGMMTFNCGSEPNSSSEGDTQIQPSFTLEDVTWLSFGKTTLKKSGTNGRNNAYILINGTANLGGGTINVDLGGGTLEKRTFTQGANELIFDGGAVWTDGTATNYDPSFLDGEDVSQRTQYTNAGVYAEAYTYTYGSLFWEQTVTVNPHALVEVQSGATLNMYSGVKITNHETRAGNGIGGGIHVSGELNMHGGEISCNAVTNCSQGTAGAGVYVGSSSSSDRGVFYFLGGKIMRNSVASVGTQRCASGVGVGVFGGKLEINGGEISFNCGATGNSGSNNLGADGGGVQGHMNESINLAAEIEMQSGSISNNWTGGYGGGVALWRSTFTMSGGNVSGNEAAWGGGICVNSATTWAYAQIRGGTISENRAVQHTFNSSTLQGGYGGGVCVGTGTQVTYSYASIEGGTFTDNEAVFGGGLAVYTDDNNNKNYIIMSGGLITNNAAYEADGAGFGSRESAQGDGIYFTSTARNNTSGNALLRLSGSAQVDSSNNVSFNFPRIEDPSSSNFTVAPISVSGGLSCSGVAALVTINTTAVTNWTDVDLISGAGSQINGADSQINKFLFDSTEYRFYVNGNNLGIRAISDPDTDSVVTVLYRDAEGNEETKSEVTSKSFTTLESAINDADTDSYDIIEISQNLTITQPITVNKTLTIRPAGTSDISLFVASDFKYGGMTNPAVLQVTGSGVTLTLEGKNNFYFILDGNKATSSGVALVTAINGASYIQNGDVRLRNNTNGAEAGALYIGSGSSATINGGEIVSNTSSNGAIYVQSNGTLNYNGGTISGNVSNIVAETGSVSVRNYGIYLSSDAVLNLGGTVNCADEIYTYGRINVLADFNVPENRNIILDFDPLRNSSGYAFVYVSEEYIAAHGNNGETVSSDLLDVFTVSGNISGNVNLANSKTSAVTGYPWQIVLDNATTYIFYFNYDYIENTMQTLSDVTYTTGAYGDYADFISYLNATSGLQEDFILRGSNAIQITLHYGESFVLNDISNNYAAYAGHSLMYWYYSDTKSRYDATFSHRDSTGTVSVYSDWEANTYTVSFDGNYGSVTGATVDLVTGSTAQQEYSVEKSSNALPQTGFVFKGYRFLGWAAKEANGSFSSPMKAGDNFLDANLNSYATVAADDKSDYTLTLYAAWESIFSSGVGIDGNEFILDDIADLETLEKTVNGITLDTGTDTDDTLPYYNTLTESGAPDYTAEDYEGYYFKLGGDIGNADTPFTGVIGRVSTDPVGGGSHAGDDAQNHLDQEDQITNAVYGDSATSGGNGAAAGTPFKGTFDGGGYTIYLNINKQKIAEKDAGATINDGYGTYTNGDETLTGVGLFGYIDHASIKNLELAGAVHGYSHVGALVGYAFGGTIEEVYNKATVTSGGHDVGGVIGTFYELYDSYTRSSVTNAANAGEVKYAPRENGDKSQTLDVEENWDELEIIDDAEGVRFGGIVGAGITLRLTGGYNAGNVTARYGVGGVVGTLRSLDDRTANDAFITQSFNIGMVTATSGLYAESMWTTGSKETLRQTFITAYTGGITGRLVGVSTVSNSFNGGTVTAAFVAEITADTVSQESGYTVAPAPEVGSTDSGTYLGARGVGGIVGFTSYKKGDSAGRIALSNVYNTGSVSAWAGVGGIAGYFAYANINEAFNGGNVTATGTHYDESARARVAGGYTVGNDSREVYVSYLGAIVGRGVSATLGATVSYNVNSSYKGYTDATVQAIGDSSYNADFGFTVNTDSAAGLTSAQMRVYEDHVLPSGFSQGFNTSGWDFLCYTPSEEDSTGGDNYSYYPQLSAFTGSTLGWTFSVNVGTAQEPKSEEMTISEISRHYARIMYTEEGGGDKPIVDKQEFTLTFVLGGGAFAFDGGSNSFEGGTKNYIQAESNSDRYYYTFTYPQDDGGATELETPKAPERVGYTFGGWYIDSTYTQEFDFGAIPGQNMVIYARWVPVSYRIDYLNVNDVGGSIIKDDYPNSFTVENAAGGRIVFPGVKDMFRRGYRFVEWQYGGEGNRQKVTSAEVITLNVSAPTLRLYNGEKTVEDILFSELNNQTLYLYAVWAEKTYNITYYLDDEAYSEGTPPGNVPEGFDKYTFGSQAFVLWSGETLNALNPGYIFNGWKIADFDDTDAQNNKNYKVGEQRSYLESGTVGDFVLVGNWTAVKYTLTFNLGIGSITPGTAEDYGLTINLGLYSLTLGYKQSLEDDGKAWSEFAPNPPTGYTFAGWYTGVNGTGDLVTLVKLGDGDGDGDGDSLFKMPAADTTLYAHYTLNTYIVTVQIPKTVGTEVTVSIDSSFKPKDYGFTEGDHTEKKDYVYTLQVSHGNGVEAALSALAAALRFTSEDPDAGTSGWHFTDWTVAWTTQGEGTPSIYRVTGALTVTANCDAEDIFINFVNRITGETIGKPVPIKAGSSVTDIPTFEDPFGYTFSHWLYDGGEYTTDELEKVTFAVSSTVYAVFEAAKVDATFYLGLGVEDPVLKDGYQYTFGARFGSFPTVGELGGKLGYEVVNWYVEKEDDSLQLVSADTLLTEDLVTQAGETYSVVLRAAIKLYKYTVTVNSGAGGSVSGYTDTSYQYNYDDGVKVVFEFPEGYRTSPNTGYELAGYLVNGEMVSCTDANAATAIAEHLLTEKITGNITITAQWQLKKYAVWFDAGDGHFVVDGSVEGVTFYNDKNATTEVENGTARYAVIFVEHNSAPDFDIVPERPGSSFSGWDYGGALNITSERSPKEDNAITAYWTTEKYSIRYELDGGEPLAGNYQTFYQYGDVINFTVSPYVPRRGGYSFLGWFDQAENGNKIESTEGMTGDLTLYAHWKVNTYALKLTINELPQGAEETIKGWFSAVEGEGISFIAEDIVGNSITVWVYANYGTSLTALNSVLQTIGEGTGRAYIPVGWRNGESAYYFSTMPESGNPLRTPIDLGALQDSGGMQLTNSYVSEGSYHTITVYLTEEDFTSGSVYTILYVLSENNTVAPVDPTRTGYTFSGWMQSNAGGEDTAFTFGNPLNADVVIYAKWAPNTYTVTFNGNGATSGIMSDQLLTYDNAEQALTPNAFSRTGYTFIGWATTSDGNVAYTDGKTTPNVTAKNGGEVTLYAVWKANTYKIAFHYDDTSASADKLADYGGESTDPVPFAYGANISCADAPIPHYSHVWYMWTNGEKAELFSNSTMPDLSDERYTDYVDKEGSTYTIHLYAVYTAETYYIRYQSGESTPVNVTMVTETKLNSAEPSLGYAFVGWELYTNGNSVSTGNYFNSFAVGEDEEGNIVVEFRTQSDGENTYSVPLGDLKSYTLVPHFEAIKYTIKFVGGDGATGSTASMSLSYGTTGTLQKNEFKKNGYNFAGWALTDNTDSVAYADGASITITSGLVEGLGEGKTITLYAVWTPIEYTITYVLNGGSLNGNPDLTYTIEESVTLASPAARTGYKFLGWFEKEDFSGSAVSQIPARSTGNKVFYAKWDPESYDVGFAENSGTGLNLSAKNALYGQQFVLTLTAQEGYTLPASVEVEMVGSSEGFYSYSNGVITISSVTGAITITANGVSKIYSVTLGEGSANVAIDVSSATYGDKVEITVTAANGYELSSVSYTMGGGEAQTVELNGAKDKVTFTISSVTGYIVVTATAAAKTFKVEDDGTNISIDWLEESATFGQDFSFTIRANVGYSLPATVTIKVGDITYTLAVGENGKVTIPASYVTDDITITANGVINRYTVTFDSNEGSAVAEQSVVYNGTATEPEQPTRTGYTFVGWFNGDTEYEFSTPILYDIELTAKWDPIQYTVAFNTNGGEGSLASQTFTYDIAEKLTNNDSIYRTGYTFLGWATEKGSNSVAYSDGASVINLASTNNETVELFAVWQINTYTLTFELTLPEAATAEQVNERMQQLSSQSIGGLAVSINLVTVDGKRVIRVTVTGEYEKDLTSFNELFDEGFRQFTGKDGQPYTLSITLPDKIKGTQSVNGEWTADNVVTLTFESNSGTRVPPQYLVSGTKPSKPSDPTRAGYVFVGWFTDNGTFKSEFDFDEVLSQSIEVYAKWDLVTYTVQYVGEDVPQDSMEFTFDGENFMLEDGSVAELPSGLDRTGYTFGGWSYNDAVYTTLAELFKETTLGDGYDASTTVIDLIAVWTPIEYTVMFNANGGMGAVNSQTITIDDADGISLNANSFVYVGYDFQGWATSAQGEVVYSDGGNFTLNDGLIPAEGTIITLYAVWSVKVYTLSFDKNAATDGVTGNLDSQTAIYEAVESNKTPAYFTLPEELTRKGYTFLGWATEEGSNSAVYAGGAMVNANQLFTGLEGEGDRSRTLYAVWQVNIYTVTYELNGGTEGTDWIKSYTVEYEDGTISLPQDATREGYTFVGWFSDAQLTGDKIASFSVSDAENKIFYAKWAAEKHTVTIDLGREGSIAELPDGAEGTEGSSGAWTKFTIKMDHDSNVYDLLDKLTVAVLGSPYQLHAGWQVTVGEGNLIALQGDITISALYSQEQIIVTVVHADGSVSHVNVKYGETLEETDVFAPKTGYNYAGWYYGENVEFVFAGKGEATVITAPITLYPNATAETYDVTTSAENTVLVGGGNDVARYGQNYVFTFIAETGYSLSDIVLKMGGESLTEEEYSYDPITGRVVIFSVTGNIEVSATVSARTYTVTFNANGGTLTGAERTDVTFGQPIEAPTEPTPPDGYTFAGWYYNGTAWDFETNTMPAGNITLVAQWERESYSVVFDNDGMKTEYTYLYGDTVTKPADPVKEGHSFLGWYWNDKEFNFETPVSDDLTLVAMWQKNTYTVTFNANGGTDVAPQEVEYLGTAKEPAAPAREGYAFMGWYLNGTQWDFDEMSVTSDITLVALWSEIRYTVRFLDGDQLVAALTVTDKGTVTAPALGAREGYTFEGWFNGETRFDFDAPITDDVTLTAKWSAAEYTVSFETGGGTAVSDQTVVHGGKISVPQIPEREGYVFTGWYFNGTAWDFEEMTVSGGMTLVAGWKAREYTVTFDPNGGSAVAEQSVVYNGTATMPEQPVREGYVFEGWFSGETQFDFAAAITGDVTLTAKWSPRGYSISYVLGGGTNAAGNPSGYTVESDTITLGAPTREGYTFAGWYDAEENGNLVTQIAAGSKGNITLYAAWQANSFEVDFVANGGTLDGADTQKVTAGGTVAYAEPVRENYLFVGWFTDEALTVRYDFKTPVTGNLTLYAKWRLQVVTGVTENGTVVTVSSDAGFDDGTQLHFVEVTDEDTVGSAAAHLRDNMTLARLFDIEIVDAGGAPVEITEPLSVGISVEGLSEAEGNWGVVYVPDGEGEIEVLATHVGDDGRLYFFVEHFSFYAVVDIAEIGAGFAWGWILVAVAGCALIALILVLVARSAHRYELNFVNGGVPAQKLKESALIDLPLPEREEEAFEGWYFDEDFRDRATLTSMPKQNLILFAKWRKLTDEERAARDRARAEAAAMAEEGFHHAAPRQEKKHKENPLSEIKEDD